MHYKDFQPDDAVREDGNVDLPFGLLLCGLAMKNPRAYSRMNAKISLE
ncbi:MAG: hypothetical protein PHQ34_14615 [Methanothrix sp.]|nr:hypothetical protein [Methanothrix sp.]